MPAKDDLSNVYLYAVTNELGELILYAGLERLDPGGSSHVDIEINQQPISLNGDGTFNYDPNNQFGDLGPGESVTDTFTYTISDGHGSTATATVTITLVGRHEIFLPLITLRRKSCDVPATRSATIRKSFPAVSRKGAIARQNSRVPGG